MNEPTPGGGSALPPPTFFDPAFERLPPAASFDAAREGAVLLVFDRAADRDWVADAAVSIATGWHAEGRRTVLADLSLDDPMLAERIGMASMEGVVDVFLYGASLARSARGVPGRGFYLISAGTYTPDAGAILRHPRWEKLCHGFHDTDASLLLFVPADAPGLAALARWAREAIVLAEREHAADVELGIPDFVEVRAWLTPPERSGAAPAVGHAQQGSPFPEPQASGGFRPWEAPAASRTAHRGEEFRSAGETVGAPAATLPVPDPGWEKAEPPPRSPRRVSPALLALLALALLAAAAYAVARLRPDLLGRAGPETAAPAAAPAAPSAGPVANAGVHLPYSVWVEGLTNFDAAQRRAREVSRAAPDARFYITYENTQGQLYYKVLSGVLSDSAQAADLRARLLERRLIDPADVGTEAALITVRPWTLELGEFPTQETAESRVDSLAARSIPAYVVPVPFSDGSEHWKVYGGAFEDSTAARPMMQLLLDAGVPGRLVRRTGRPPAAPK